MLLSCAYANGRQRSRLSAGWPRRPEAAQVVARIDLSGLFHGEAAAQHRSDQMHPAAVILDAPRESND
jgi:hypothetical protein